MNLGVQVVPMSLHGAYVCTRMVFGPFGVCRSPSRIVGVPPVMGAVDLVDPKLNSMQRRHEMRGACSWDSEGHLQTRPRRQRFFGELSLLAVPAIL